MDRRNLFTRLLIVFLSLMFFGGLALGIFNLASSEGQQFPEESPQENGFRIPEKGEDVLSFIGGLVESAVEEKAGVKNTYEIEIDDNSISAGKGGEALTAALNYIKDDVLREFSKKYEGTQVDFGQDFIPVLLGLDFSPESIAEATNAKKGEGYELSLSFFHAESIFDTAQSKELIGDLLESYESVADLIELEIKTENLSLNCVCDSSGRKIKSLTYTKGFSVNAKVGFKGELEKIGVKPISFTYQEKAVFEFIYLGLELAPKELRMKKGETKLVNAYVTAGDKASLSWSSSDDSIASVDQEGYVKAHGTSTLPVTIVAEFTYLGKTYKDTCQVHVTIPVKKISLSPRRLDLKVGEEAELTAAVKPKDATIKEVIWFSENEGVASVDENGGVKGLSAGETKVYVLSKDGYYRLSCKVRVRE